MEINKVENELLELENQFWEAIKNKDADTAKRLTDDTCIVTGAQGVARIDKQALGFMIEDARYTLNDFELKDAQVRLLNDDVAVVAYRAHEELTVDGAPVTVEAADSSTWIRRDGSWLCAMHSEAISGDPYGRDKAQATT